MKFEHLLHIYWSNHFLFNGRINSLDTKFKHFFFNVGGLKKTTKLLFVKRFELIYFNFKIDVTFNIFSNEIRRALNIILSQISTVNNQTSEIRRFAIIKLYLLKTYKGYSHALGKPLRGQRT